MTNVTGYDMIHAYLASAPPTGQPAGYTTGTPDIRWTDADFAAHPGAIRICQDTGTDTTADVLDVERYAATNADAATWYLAALASYVAGIRPGQRQPAIYTSQSNVTPLVNTLIAAGITSGPRLWVALWDGSLANAEAALDASSGPFPLIGRQYADGAMLGTSYDADVWRSDWLTTTSGGTMPPNSPAAWLPGTVHVFLDLSGNLVISGVADDNCLYVGQLEPDFSVTNFRRVSDPLVFGPAVP